MVIVIVIIENTFTYFFFSIISVLKSDCIALIVTGSQVIDWYLYRFVVLKPVYLNIVNIFF